MAPRRRKTQEVIETPKTPEVTETQEKQEAPEVIEVTETQEVTETPEATEATEATEVTETIETPEAIKDPEELEESEYIDPEDESTDVDSDEESEDVDSSDESTDVDSSDEDKAEDEASHIHMKLTPSQLREVREGLGLSRKNVMDATSLSGSVIWRSEQDDKSIPTDAKQLIVDFYNEVNQGNRQDIIRTARNTGRRATGNRVTSMTMAENNALALARTEIDELKKEITDLEASAQVLVDRAVARRMEALSTLTRYVEIQIAAARNKRQDTTGLDEVLSKIAEIA